MFNLFQTKLLLEKMEKFTQCLLIHTVKVCKQILIKVYAMNVAFTGAAKDRHSKAHRKSKNEMMKDIFEFD